MKIKNSKLLVNVMCMIAMLIDYPNDHIAMIEALMLQSIMADVVRDHAEHFKLVG